MASDRDEQRAIEAPGLMRIAEHALKQFSELIGLIPERISGARPEGNGWSLLVDVVEVERIPTTMSVLASYRVDIDRNGALLSYERLRRFTRLTTD